ncbi:MAG: efflux RND transporter periplasmic adaptor subunit [Thermoanaerobaculia bacterium]
MKRRLLVAAAILAVLSAGWIAQSRLLASREGEWVTVDRGDLVMGVEVAGILESTDSSRLGPPPFPDMHNFRISMMAPEGKEVKAGEPVLAFDATEQQKTLQEKTAERDSARKEIEKARADLAIRREQEELALAQADAQLRKAELKLQAPEELQGANERRQIELDRDLAKREIEHRRQRLASFDAAAAREIALLREKEARADMIVRRAQEKIEKMRVRAPRDGTVVYITSWRDEKKKVGDSVWRMENVIEIPDLRSMMAKGEVDEADAGKVRMNQRASIRLDAHPDQEFHGSVSSIGRTVERQSPRTPLKILRVDIGLDKTDLEKMRPGMRFRGRLETGRAKDVVLIPHEAVFTTAEGPIAVRRTLSGRERVRLELGRRNDERIEVISGLAPGDRVLLRKAEDESEEEEGS